MTTKQKFTIKKRAKRNNVIAWLLLMIFFANIAGAVIWRFHSDATIDVKMAMFIMFLTISPIFVSLIFLFYSQYNINTLKQYKANLIEYRTRKYFQLLMECVRSNDLNGVIYYYNNFIPRNHETRSYIYGIILGMSLFSNNPEYVEKGEKNFKHSINQFKPENVIL